MGYIWLSKHKSRVILVSSKTYAVRMSSNVVPLRNGILLAMAAGSALENR